MVTQNQDEQIAVAPEVDPDEAASASIRSEIEHLNRLEDSGLTDDTVPGSEEGASGSSPLTGDITPPAVNEVPLPAATGDAPPSETAASSPSEVPVAPTRPQAEASEVQRLRMELETERSKQVVQEIDRRAEQVRQNLTSQGYTEEDASRAAEQQRQNDQTVYQTNHRAQEALQEQEAKYQSAIVFNQQFGVPIQDLLVYNTPASMEAAARQFQMVQQTKQQLAAAQKASVTAQVMDNGVSTASPARSDNDLLDEYNNGARTEVHMKAVKRSMGH